MGGPREVLPEIHQGWVLRGPWAGRVSVTLSLAACCDMFGQRPSLPTIRALDAAQTGLCKGLNEQVRQARGSRWVPEDLVVADEVTQLPWITVFLRKPPDIKRQELRPYLRGLLNGCVREARLRGGRHDEEGGGRQFEIFGDVPDPTAVLYVWVEVGLGGSYKLDELRVTFSTPQLKLIFHKSDEATPQELAALIARYTKVPGIKIGDERRDPVATAETVTLYFYRRGIAQVVGGIAEVVGDIEQIVPIRLRGTRVHYVMIPPEQRGALGDLSDLTGPPESE